MDEASQETPSDDFGFAFNQVRFSDSVLRIEIIPDPSGSSAESDNSLADWIRNRKRRRVDQITNSDETVEKYKENNLNHSAQDLQDELSCEYHLARLRSWLMTDMAPDDLENAPNRADVSVSGSGTAQEYETSSSMEVKTIHISSPILAAKSPFFYKLLSNGERDSEPRHVTLRIHASEEDALMDLLNFIYCNTLRSTTPTALLNVLMAADKFEVASCMRYCSQLLHNSPMSCESALLYLDLPSLLRKTDTVQPLAEAAKKFLAARFKDISKCQEEVWKLPLLGLEAVLSSDDLQVSSEDVIFRLVVRWARKHYPNLHDRRQILSTRLIPYIRFPHMSCLELKTVLATSDIDATSAAKAVLDALFCKAQYPFNDRSLGSNPTQRRASGRSYSWRPIKVMELETPRQQRICYLDLTREECARLFPSNSFWSQWFDIGGHEFYLRGQCCGVNGLHTFGLFLGVRWKTGSAASLKIDYEFASRAKPSLDFVSRFKAKSTFTGFVSFGHRNLFGAPWNVFIADDSPYFIDGVLHLRAELTVTTV